MISGGIKVFDKSSNLLVDGASVSVGSGSATKDALLQTNPLVRYRSVGSDDTTTETIEITLPIAKSIDRLMALDINWKQFTAQYWNGSTWVDFTTVVGLGGALGGGISETAFAANTAYYEFDAVTISKYRWQVVKTQTADEEKYCGQLIATAELHTFAGYPAVRDPTFTRTERIQAMLSGKASIARANETFEVTLDFSNYPSDSEYNPDLDLLSTLLERDTDLLIWLCGGRYSSSYFNYAIRGFRLQDVIQVQFVGGLRNSYHRNWYRGPVTTRAKFVETVAGSDEGGTSVNVQVIIVTADYVASDEDEIIFVNANAGAVEVTLPAPSSVGEGKKYGIKKIDSTSNLVTVTPAGGKLVDDEAGAILRRKDDAVSLISDSDDYYRFSWVHRDRDYVDLEEQGSSPGNPDTGFRRMYVDEDGIVYLLDNSGVASRLGSGGANALTWELPSSNGPLESNANGIPVFLFDQASLNEIVGVFKVPETYLAGKQISLVGGIYSSPATTGNVLFRTQTTLVEHGSTQIGTHTNQRTSTNAEQTVPGTANQGQEISDIDLTDASGQINGQAVAPGDHLYIRLYRDNTNESSPADDVAQLIKNSFEVKTDG